MRVSFRQGIVQYQVDNQGNQNFLQSTGTGVSLLANVTPFIATLAQKDANYLIDITQTVVNAWSGPFQSQVQTWLYIDVNLVTAAQTFGTTTLQPVVSPYAPTTNLQTGLHWFDTTSVQMKIYTGNGWQVVVRVFVGSVVGGSASFYSMTGNSGNYGGTQIGVNVGNFSGPLVYDAYGKPLRTSNGTFFTTESTTTVDGSTGNVRLAADLLTAQSLAPIPAFSVVYFPAFNVINLATPTLTVAPRIFGIVTENLQVGDTCYVYTDCVITNNNWAFTQMHAAVYADTDGQVTLTQQLDQQSIGYTVAPNAIRIEPVSTIIQNVTPPLTESALYAMLQQFVGSLSIVGPATLTANTSQQYTLQFTSSVNGSIINPALCHIGVSGDGELAYIDGNNTLYVGNVTESTQVELTAYYPFGISVSSATMQVTLNPAQPVSIAISGPSTIYEGHSASYVTTATFPNGSTQQVEAVLVIGNTVVASINQSNLGVRIFSSVGIASGVNSISDTILATYTLTDGSGTVLTASMSVTYLRVLPVSLQVQGASAVLSGASSQYQAILTNNSGSTANVTATSTWSLTDTIGLSSITQTGLLQIGAVYSPSSVTVQASYTANGVIVTANEVVQVMCPALYGIGPALPSDMATFIPTLQYHGTSGSLDASFAIDDIGFANYMWYAYPMSYGLATFLDVGSQLTGGWDGAGNSGDGSTQYGGPIQVGIDTNGVGTTYYVYRTDHSNLGAAATNQWVVS